MAILKKTRDNECWEDCEVKGTPYTIDGNVNWYSHYRQLYGSSLKNNK